MRVRTVLHVVSYCFFLSSPSSSSSDDTDIHPWCSQVVTGIQDQEFSVTDVVEGKEYLFRVTAVNKCGPGEPAYIDEPVNVSSPASEFLPSLTSSSVISFCCTINSNLTASFPQPSPIPQRTFAGGTNQPAASSSPGSRPSTTAALGSAATTWTAAREEATSGRPAAI